MSKPSNWNRWKQRYGPGQRGRDKGSAGFTEQDLTRFAETSRGPVARALWEQELIDYDDSGNVAVQRENVKEAASRLTKDAQYINTGRNADEVVHAIQSQEGLSKRAAVQRANRATAAQAQAVLDAARIGKVSLTTAQRERLTRLSKGEYIEADKLPRQKGPSYRNTSRDRLYEQARYEEQREQLREISQRKEFGYNSQRRIA